MREAREETARILGLDRVAKRLLKTPERELKKDFDKPILPCPGVEKVVLPRVGWHDTAVKLQKLYERRVAGKLIDGRVDVLELIRCDFPNLVLFLQQPVYRGGRPSTELHVQYGLLGWQGLGIVRRILERQGEDVDSILVWGDVDVVVIKGCAIRFRKSLALLDRLMGKVLRREHYRFSPSIYGL